MSATKKLTVPRLQLWEFCDHAFLHAALREAYMDCLNLLFVLGGLYKKLSRRFALWCESHSSKSHLDLASGAAGPMITLLRESEKRGYSLPPVTLSDINPNISHWSVSQREFTPERLDYIRRPFDLRHELLKADSLSIFGAFHHFSPKDAGEIVKRAVKEGKPLFIIEAFTRTWRNVLLQVILTPLIIPTLMVLVPLTAKKITLSKTLFTTFLPIVPLMVVFDGVVSLFRSYTENELRAMIPAEEAEHFDAEFLRVPYTMGLSEGYAFSVKRKPTSCRELTSRTESIMSCLVAPAIVMESNQ